MQENRFFKDTYNLFNQIMGNDAVKNFQPRITAQVPESWFVKESITLLAPDAQANIIASSEPLNSADIDLTRYAEDQGKSLQFECPYYRELSFNSALVFGNRRGYVRRFQWTPPNGTPVTQIQIYYVENGCGYTATATTPTAHFERYEKQLEKILGSLRIGQA